MDSVRNIPDKNQQLSKILYELKEEGIFQGVSLSYKNGEPICNIFNETLNDVDVPELSSMCASVLEGVNNLSKVIGEERLIKAVAELQKYMLFIIQCDKNVFLTLIADRNSRVNTVLDSIERFQKKIIFLY
jgi:predicted regulator of Ras-like GTPase activity (Roadblock/LC7/MglB family)